MSGGADADGVDVGRICRNLPEVDEWVLFRVIGGVGGVDVGRISGNLPEVDEWVFFRLIGGFGGRRRQR